MNSISTEQHDKKPSEWWRWPLVPLASALAGSVGAALVTIFFWVSMKFQGGYSENGWFYLYVLPIISSGVSGYLYSVAACAVAPRGKVITGVVMTTILGILLLGTVLFAWLSADNTIGKAIQTTIWAVVAMIAAIAVIVEHR